MLPEELEIIDEMVDKFVSRCFVEIDRDLATEIFHKVIPRRISGNMTQADVIAQSSLFSTTCGVDFSIIESFDCFTHFAYLKIMALRESKSNTLSKE